MDETQLRNFLMISRCASITEAADRLGIAQPSLSQQLLRLEDEFRAKLFQRTSRGVVPTEAGRMLFEHALTILQAMNRAREAIVDSGREPHGEVRIGLPPTASALLGVPIMIAARERLPQVLLRIHEATGASIRKRLDEGRLDLAILYDAEDSRHLLSRPIARETLLLVGPKGIFGEEGEDGIALSPVDPSALSRRDLILPSISNGLRRLTERRLKAHNIELPTTIEIDSLAHTKTLIRSGLGYSLLSHAAIRQELADGELSAAPVGHVDFSRIVSFARNPAHLLTRASLQVEDLARELLRDMILDGRWLAELAEEFVEA